MRYPFDATLDRYVNRRRNTRTPRPANDTASDYWQRMSDALLDASVHWVN